MYCPNCKKDVGCDALFCPECGTPTTSLSPQRCSTCGTPLVSDMAFCSGCGKPVSETPKTEQPDYIPQNLKHGPQMYGPQGDYQQQWEPQPEQGYRQQGTIPPTPEKKKASMGIIAAACAGVLIVCAAAIFLLARMDKDDSRTVRSEEKSTQEQKDDKDASDSVSKDEKNEKEEKEKKEKKKEKKNSKGSKPDVVQVIGNDPTATPAAGQSTDPAAAPAQSISKTFSGVKDRATQQTILTTGGQLDLQHMNNLLANAGATYGTYVLDITNMQEYDGGNADTPLPASALIGIPILFTIADGVDKGEINLDTPVTLAYTFANGRGVFKSGDNGRTFPVSQMLSEALINSDNNALNSLIDFLSLDRINTTCRSYGFNSVDIQRKLVTGSTTLENYISPKDAAMMLNTIYQDNFTGIGKTFLQTNFKISGSDSANRGMYPACGSCAMFLNLNGITDSRYNEIGVIQNGDEVFILSVFTCNGVGTTSASALTTLSSYVVSTLHAQ